jgi:hypothetical protein
MMSDEAKLMKFGGAASRVNLPASRRAFRQTEFARA